MSGNVVEAGSEFSLYFSCVRATDSVKNRNIVKNLRAVAAHTVRQVICLQQQKYHEIGPIVGILDLESFARASRT